MLDNPPGYKVDKRPESPRSGEPRPEPTQQSGLNPFLNKMTLKRPREGYEEKMDRRHIRSKLGELQAKPKRVVRNLFAWGGRGRGRSKQKAQKGREKSEMVGQDKEGNGMTERSWIEEEEAKSGSGGCRKTATRDQ